MANYTRAFITECPGDLLDSINSDPAITNSANQMIVNGNDTVTFEFTGTLSAQEEIDLDIILANWECPDNYVEVDEVIIDDSLPDSSRLWSSEKIHTYVQSEVANAAAGDLTNLIGKTTSVGFTHSSSSVGNSWLRMESNDSGTTSDKVPFVVPFNCRLLSVMYSNADNGVDCDLQIWKSPLLTEPRDNKSMVHEIEIRNHRGYIRTDFGTPVDFAIGDKVGVYLRDRGTNSDHPVVQLTFIVMDSVVVDTGYSYSTHFSTNNNN